ncbi:hypothetical protein A2276_08045 [candidate division WOR-1 bacterium RIFOXYA12_FULL_43_27]|uniref:Glycosyltransferase 2-like domain-containing protein n=1 Tax=candidate division WOR-1 bacterium RIFOXYC2_FULL_46_14 TaxID=1802587 RepID=A0A1F4U687_UNCSA|nr:MAG: hypothetical protein A2276_08045 [candidate division WOR-1 bacterium RIFOXYA12_FULL_43_27]OGC20547.1 MAG: hypothetical protein A2292_05870 [candidate division WOR-1 bacterium RIFOXYB2_FULL_46_45]OGC31716.1 MAG: hypothetical protein A2232_05580 [candidate division WOR-1 bacterium RIFOXYA2_FULL_46_56]OGC40389.1 MAG: hypothetical protein A2438_03900 [candidate division WOR-1 bacterium RIFOXYC2_FULL_46_14]
MALTRAARIASYLSSNNAINRSLNAFGYFARATYSGYVPGRTRDLASIAQHLDGSKELEITPEGIFIDHSQQVSTNPFLIEAFLEHQITKIETSGIDYKDLVKLSKGEMPEGLESQITRDEASAQQSLEKVMDKNNQKVMRLNALAALYGGILYASYKVLMLAVQIAPLSAIDLFCNIILVTCTISYAAINIIKQKFVADSTQYIPPKATEEEKEFAKGKDGPKITLLIPARNEPTKVLRRTLQAAEHLDYKNYEVVLLLDSYPNSENFKDVMQMYEQEFRTNPKIKVFARKRHQTVRNQKLNKADCVNAFLNDAHGRQFEETFFIASEFIAITDADYRLYPEFLAETVPHLLRDKDNAYVMTPQNFPQERGNPVEQSTAALINSSWQIVNRGAAHSTRVLFGGCNAVIRMSALESVAVYRETGEKDYLPTDTITEDLALTLRFFEKKYKSVYLPQPLAVGDPISSLGDIFATYWRYGEGSTENTLKHTIPFMRRGIINLNSWEGADYLAKAINPFMVALVGGISQFHLLSLFGVQLIGTSALAPILYYFLLSNSAKAALKKQGIKDPLAVAKITTLTFIQFPVFVDSTYTAIKNYLLGKEASYRVTKKDGSRTRVPLKYLLPLLGTFSSSIYSFAGHLSEFSASHDLWRIEAASWATLPILSIGYGLTHFNGIKNTLSDLYYGFKEFGRDVKDSTTSTALALGRLNFPV